MKATSSKQIILGLKCCRSEYRFCNKCPYSNMNDSVCATILRLDAIEMIEKQYTNEGGIKYKPMDEVYFWLPKLPGKNSPLKVTVLSERGEDGTYLVTHDPGAADAWLIVHEDQLWTEEELKNGKKV